MQNIKDQIQALKNELNKPFIGSRRDTFNHFAILQEQIVELELLLSGEYVMPTMTSELEAKLFQADKQLKSLGFFRTCGISSGDKVNRYNFGSKYLKCDDKTGEVWQFTLNVLTVDELPKV